MKPKATKAIPMSDVNVEDSDDDDIDPAVLADLDDDEVLDDDALQAAALKQVAKEKGDLDDD